MLGIWLKQINVSIVMLIVGFSSWVPFFSNTLYVKMDKWPRYDCLIALKFRGMHPMPTPWLRYCIYRYINNDTKLLKNHSFYSIDKSVARRFILLLSNCEEYWKIVKRNIYINIYTERKREHHGPTCVPKLKC